MLISRLRLTGFKSFVDTTELLIEPGLTGVVGPNGCGKSNLLEALRWVMGETSYKSMRASAMDDVIFSGTVTRPARNTAEVTIVIDNHDRTAPAEFNDTDLLEISRRIERESGSSYRINGREARARDIKILFEDAATGARSPALVRQGQIGEIVNAKPEQRRRILEDAAGIAGLRSRRHDAELRLNAAEGNLTRLSDILGQMHSQIEGLRRQARQATRYKEISEAVRRSEAAVLYLTWRAAARDAETREDAYRSTLESLNAATAEEARRTTEDVAASEQLQPLREQEAERAAARARLTAERDTVARDIVAAEARLEDLKSQQATLAGDLKREFGRAEDALEAKANLTQTIETLAKTLESNRARHDELVASQAELDAAVKQADSERAKLTSETFQRDAARRSGETKIAERENALKTATSQLEQAQAEQAKLDTAAEPSASLTECQQRVREHEQLLQTFAGDLETAERRADEASVAHDQARETVQSAALALREIETEAKTLERMLRATESGGALPVLDQLTVQPGYEAALAAALGDDLNAPVGGNAALRWLDIGTEESELPEPKADDPPLPKAATSLASFVSGGNVLARRLRQIGVVDTEDGPHLQSQLAVGQRLVSRSGELWRWDGFVAAAGAPTAATVRLEQRNRLEALSHERVSASSKHDTASKTQIERKAALERARSDHTVLVRRRDETRRNLEAAVKAVREIETASAALAARRQALAQRCSDFEATRERAQQALAEARTAYEALPLSDALKDQLDRCEQTLAQARQAADSGRATVAGLKRELTLEEQRQRGLETELKATVMREAAARKHIAELEQRTETVAEQLVLAAAQPGELNARAEAIAKRIEIAEHERRSAADAVVEAETRAKAAHSALRTAQAAVAEAREQKARDETLLEAARAALLDAAKVARETLEVEPETCCTLAGLDADGDLPELSTATAKLTKLRSDRDRLGGVNLQAGEELAALEADYGMRDKERADVEEAIAKLRGAISQLNREARRRLLEAFEGVNTQFGNLFETLFGGGEARLELVDSDDPLEGGLEIIAKPPGKKPSTLSLLSGGEQTLTALSLIFAVFLTNPSPICVLDEVDAPLDDANVERFCTLMESMAERTATRFLVITHHPLTMARMQRLFGVTMAERGVSQLVSVDLTGAERFLEAG